MDVVEPTNPNEPTISCPEEPDWGPLEAVVPPSVCERFMFMGIANDRVRLYKNRDTRRYLNLDPAGNAYRYRETGVPGGYEQIPLDEALAHLHS